MGFGAIIASGQNNQLLDDALLNCITEVRVEQFLDDATRFAIRFEEDLNSGEPMNMGNPNAQCEQMYAIGVQTGENIECLVRGPITDIKYSAQLGGPGSWYEIHGQDRRIELDRRHVNYAWSGKASDAAHKILGNSFTVDVEQTNVQYGGSAQTLNQRGTDAEFIRQIARDCNLHFWLEYDCQLKGETLDIVEKANLKPSPPRPKDNRVQSILPDQVTLIPTVPLTLRVNVDKTQCQNVTAFELSMNPERPNHFTGNYVNDREVQLRSANATDPQPIIKSDGARFADCQTQKDVWITTAGSGGELQQRAESALTSAGWFLEATANTTAHMLGGVLKPHDVVEVKGLGSRHSGPYQVKTVTHVINAADHFMDVELRRNAVGRD